jgi:ribonuclease E
MEIQLILCLAVFVVIGYLLFVTTKATTKVTVESTPAEAEPVILNADPVVEEAPAKKPRKPRAAKTAAPAAKAKSPSAAKPKTTAKTAAKKTTAKSKKV